MDPILAAFQQAQAGSGAGQGPQAWADASQKGVQQLGPSRGPAEGEEGDEDEDAGAAGGLPRQG